MGRHLYNVVIKDVRREISSEIRKTILWMNLLKGVYA